MSNDNQHIPSGYKPSPLGIIPEDWEVKTIGECTNLLTNGFVGVATPHYTEDPDGITYIQGFNVTEGGFNLTGIKKVTRAFHKKNSKSSLREGDLLTIQTGDIGLTTIVTKELEGSNCHALIISRFKEMILPQFMLYYYNSPIGRNRFRIIETGTTMKHINTGDLVKFSIPAPSLPEQQRIVSLLSLWDTAIAKQIALIEQLTLRKRGLMQQLLTGKKRLKGFEGEWKEVRLGEVAHITMGQSPDSKYYNEIGLGLPLIQGNADIQDRKSIQRIWTSSITKTCEDGDIIMSVRAPVGEIARATQKSCIGRGVCAIRNIDIEKDFLYQLLLFEEYSWKNIEQGGTFTAINSNEIQKKTLVLPTTDEQTSIASVLINADKEIEIQKQKLAAMQEEKKGLMQVLLTGKKRIN